MVVSVPQKHRCKQWMYRKRRNTGSVENVKAMQTNQSADTKSAKNLEIKINEEYNGSVSHSLKWHTDLNQAQLKQVEKWIGQVVNHDAKRITDTASWYKGRINGDDLFVIYSTEEATSTILYEVKGVQAKVELDILMDVLEEFENGKSANGKSAYVNWVFSGGWMRQGNGIRHNISRLGSGQNNQNAGVLQSQSQGKPSEAFENVIRNLFKIQKQRGTKSYSLKDQDYLKAVENGDTKTAQKMVDAAAKKAGYVGTYYHGSKSDFTVFKKEFGGASNSNAGIGFWFTETEEGAKAWTDNAWWGENKQGKVYKTYLRLNNPKVYETVDTKAQRDDLKKGYEGIDKEMSLYDSIYHFEDGRRYHTERFDYDKSQRRSAGYNEWSAFEAIA